MRPPRLEDDIDTIRDALIVLSGYLPLFSGDPRRVKRAEAAHELQEQALDALDRAADKLHVPRPTRITRWTRP